MRIALATMPYASVHAALTFGRERVVREVFDRAEQRRADRVVVLGEHAELAVVAAELLQEGMSSSGWSTIWTTCTSARSSLLRCTSMFTGKRSRVSGAAEQRGVEMSCEGLGLRGHASKLDRMISTMSSVFGGAVAAGDPRGALVGEHLVRGHRVAARGSGARSRRTRVVGGADMVVPFGGRPACARWGARDEE